MNIEESKVNIQPENRIRDCFLSKSSRGDFTKESHIDVMILLNCSKEEVREYRKQVSRLASRIGLKNDIEISLLLRDRENFENGIDILPFTKMWQKKEWHCMRSVLI